MLPSGFPRADGVPAIRRDFAENPERLKRSSAPNFLRAPRPRLARTWDGRSPGSWIVASRHLPDIRLLLSRLAYQWYLAVGYPFTVAGAAVAFGGAQKRLTL